MGRTLYAYADKIWEVSQRFVSTGEAREFTIDPGEYLFICKGGAGGGTSPTGHWGYGGVAYGVFETDRQETLYAMVGGNGEGYDGTTNLHRGGWNGGGNGGTSTLGYVSGGGGGGASDIRLTLDDTEVPPLYENNLPPEYREEAFLHMRHLDDGYLDTGYIPKANTRLEMDVWFHAWASEKNGNWRFAYGTRSAADHRDSIGLGIRQNDDMRTRALSYYDYPFAADNGLMIYNTKLHLVHNDENHRITWTDGVRSNYVQLPYEQVDCQYPLYMFTLNTSGSAEGSMYAYGMRLYYLKIYEGDTLVRDFIPCIRLSDSKVGMYDKVTNTFRPVNGYLYSMPKETTTRTLLSRIIVASGGGGNSRFSVDYGMRKSYYGGGEIGGWMSPTSTSFYDSLEYNYADQSTQPADSRCKFGKGMDGVTRTAANNYAAEGAGGGGGGWYGGYSMANWTAQYSSIGGAGGSSYALTATSWKPDGYIPDSHYYLHDTVLVGCQSSEGEVIICTPVKLLKEGDKIISPLTGKPSKIHLYPGTYDVKCWGGEGENHTQVEARSYGGYSEGRLTLDHPHDTYAVVGGSGYFYDARTTDTPPGGHNPLSGYNGGGGEVRKYQLYQKTSKIFRGGGATDLRLTLDTSPVRPGTPDPDRRDDIPSAYTQMKSITSNNPFDCGYYACTDTEIWMDAIFSNLHSSSYTNIWGDDLGFELYSVASGWNGIVFNWMNESINNTGNYITENERIILQADKTGISWTGSDAASLTFSTEPTQRRNSGTLAFGALNRGGSYIDTITWTLFRMKISEDGVLLHDFAPVKRNSDSVLGLYDAVNDTFYTWGTSYAPLSDSITGPPQTLMSRIIVAGGAGGAGCSSGLGGTGGGTTGGAAQSGYGENNGPGTQSGSPTSSSHPELDGGFGYGGSGVLADGGRGGSGGGGWFGGSGTYPDYSSDDDKGGAGGSGYVLTESSWKPDYYIPDSEFYMTNAVTTAGGNTLPPNVSKLEIDVIQAFCNKLLLHDSTGYKTYDEDQSQWVTFSDSITPELVEEYGRYDIPNIEGMLDNFEVVTDDPEDIITAIEIDIIPLPQSIVFLIPRRYSINRSIVDAIYDTSIYDFSTNVERYNNQYNAFTITVDKLQDSDEVLKLYSIMLFSK